MWLWGYAKIIGTSTNALKISSMRARSRAAKTPRIPEIIARPASTKAMPVRMAQKIPPRGIQLGIMAATPCMPVICAKPKKTEHNPKMQRAMTAVRGDNESLYEELRAYGDA